MVAMGDATNTEDDARAARMAAYQKITIADRVARHEEIAARKADAMEARRALGRDYLARHPGGIFVAPERAVACVDLTKETAGAREESMRLCAGRAAEVNNGA